MDQNSQNIALIKNLRTARPTLSFNLIFDFLGHFSIRCIYYFSKKVLIILRWNTKHVEYWLGVQFPLNKIYKAIDIDMLKFHKWGYALCPLEAWTLELIFSTFPSGDLQVLYQLTSQSFRRSAKSSFGCHSNHTGPLIGVNYPWGDGCGSVSPEIHLNMADPVALCW